MTKAALIEKATAEFTSAQISETVNLASYLYEDLSHNYRHDEILELWDASIRKIIAGIPLQFVTEVAHFYGHIFHVNNNVLIPRPETEELVFEVVKYLKGRSDTKRILDIGTGSGCIPISLKLALPNTNVSAIDISKKALDVARKNVTKLQAEVHLEQVDFLNKKDRESLQKYDVIISNPPYIPTREKQLMKANVLDHEPHLALFVEDKDPLIFYRVIAEFGLSNLNSDGAIFLEINEFNADDAVHLFHSYGYKNVRLLSDMQGKDRMVVASN